MSPCRYIWTHDMNPKANSFVNIFNVSTCRLRPTVRTGSCLYYIGDLE